MFGTGFTDMVEITQQQIQAFLIQKLKSVGYQNNKAYAAVSFADLLKFLEKDKAAVFRAVFGTGNLKHGDYEQEAYKYHLAQAENDLKARYIKMMMHYIVMQIKRGNVYL